MKQPKYFYSSEKPQKRDLLRVPSLTLPEGTQAILEKARQPRHIPKGIFFLAGVFILGIMSSLVIASTTNASMTVRLPSILPRQSNQALVAQTTSGSPQGINFDVRVGDARVEIVKSFLERYKSPLQPADHYAAILVESADRYQLDYRLLPAIMMQESNLCKTSDPALHNCLGFGIHKNGTLGFDTYEEGFDRAARELKERYIDIGLKTPEQIMTKYTPSSNGSWATSVNQWIGEMEHNDRLAGISQKDDIDLTQYTSKSL